MMPLLLALVAPVAHAAPCELLVDGMPDGPVPASFYDGGLGRAHAVCPRSEVGIGGSGYLVSDAANFYGHIVASGVLDARVAVTPRFELYGASEFLRWDNAIGAISASWLGYGHTTLGANGIVLRQDTVVLAVNGKVVTPTAVGLYHGSWPVGVDVGLAGVWSKSDHFRAEAQLTMLGSAAITAAASQPRLGVGVDTGVEWRPSKGFGLVAQLDAGMGYTAPLDHLAAGLGLRTRLGARGGLELGGVVPFAGRERALTSVALRGSWRLGRVGEADDVPGATPITPLDMPVVPKEGE